MKKLFAALVWNELGDANLIATSFDLGDVMDKIYEESIHLTRKELSRRFATLEIYNIPNNISNDISDDMIPREVYSRLVDNMLYPDEVYEIHDFYRQKVLNDNGVIIDFVSAVEFMDDEIAERVHNSFAPCKNQEFFEAYCKAHLDKYGEEFEFNKKSPCV